MPSLSFAQIQMALVGIVKTQEYHLVDFCLYNAMDYPLLCLLYSPEIICKAYKRWLYFDDPLIAKIRARSKFCLTSRGLESGPRQIENMKTWLLLQSLMGAVKRCLAGSNREITMCGFLLSTQLRG